MNAAARRSVVIAAVALGLAVWRYFAIPAPVRHYDGQTAELTMEAAGFSRPAPYGSQTPVRLNGVSGILYTSGAFSPGDRLTGSFRVTVTPRSGNHFKATSYTDITVEKGRVRPGDWPSVWANAVKKRIIALYGGGDSAALLTGILTGDRSGFSDSLREDLFTVGMTHVAAVSGLHISMLAGFITLVTRSRRRSFVLTLPLIFLYAALTGFTPSAVRAGIMIALYTLAPLFGREYHPIRALTAAFLILLVINPYALFEPGLQLSFSATLGLLVFAPRWKKRLGALPAASLAALVFSTPFAAYWFGGVSLISPLCNVLLLWPVGFIFICGAASLLVTPLAMIAAPALYLFRGVVGLFGRIPYAVLYTSQPYMTAWLIYAYILFLLMLATRRLKEPAILAAAALALCLTLTVWRDGRFGLEIAVLDVGQGQCVVIRSGGHTAVYDCGGNAYAGRAAIRYLQSRGERRVDYLLLSHYDADHVNGVPALSEVVSVKETLGPALDNMPDTCDIRTISGEERFTLGKAEITLIPADWIGADNEQCMSVLVTLDGFSFLATGDLGHSAERWLLRWADLPGGGVLMAGHHGSSGSASRELLDALSPQAVVISVGVNRYGHPAPATLRRLFDSGAAVYRTDRRGDIIIRI